jgi:hypothetical protein
VRIEEKKEPLYPLVNYCSYYENQFGSSIRKLKIEVPYGSAIPLLGTHPKECQSALDGGTRTPMFIAAPFTVAKAWKCKCPEIRG